ncbi:MAG: phosphatase PAP2 family protein [Gammaproteobacteria bacterium]|nr:phosphatase PAP2 family protein [Gammaproteobacteria bacterium]
MLKQLINKLDFVESDWVLLAIRLCNNPNVRRLLVAVSKAGDGTLWVVLILGQMLLDPAEAAWGGVIALCGLFNLSLYKLIKHQTLRNRPCVRWPHIRNATAALDHYSFPSGHTLHATTFSIMLCTLYPAAIWVLLPFAVLVAVSRVVMGLHYPSDVLAAVVIGYGVAEFGLGLIAV